MEGSEQRLCYRLETRYTLGTHQDSTHGLPKQLEKVACKQWTVKIGE